MEITFGTRKLKKMCESQREIRRAHGDGCAKKLEARLSDLQAAKTLAEMAKLPGRCHELKGDRAGRLAIDLSDGKRVIFEPTTRPPPTKEDGGLDWAGVDEIQIVGIEDYH